MVKSAQVDTVLGKIAIHTRGSGEAMMFWPSLLMTGQMWTAQADHFGNDHQVILVDPPGHGGSEKLTKPFTFDECVRCIVDILDGLGIERTHFIGNSWGGMIGGTFAATYPDRIGHAVLMNCTASAAGTRQKIEYGVMLRVAKLLGGVRPPLTRSVLKGFLGPTTFTTRPDVVAFVRDTVQALRHRVVLLGGQERGADAARPARAARAGEDARARGRGRRRCDVPAARDDRDGRGHSRCRHLPCWTASRISRDWRTLRWSTSSSRSSFFAGSFEA